MELHRGEKMSIVESWFDRVLLSSAVVANVSDLADGFRLIELEGPSLKKKACSPGDKIQVRAAGLAMRTYTPAGWDAARGYTRICASLHGTGPGARWVRSVRKGDSCSFFGPRRSVSLAKIAGDVVLFGDETSVGVGASLRAFHPHGTRLIYEGTTTKHLRAALDVMALDDASIVERKANDDHLGEIGKQIAAWATPNTTIVLTGRARSLVTLRQQLRDARCPAQTTAKAYWAEGRSGMD